MRLSMFVLNASLAMTLMACGANGENEAAASGSPAASASDGGGMTNSKPEPAGEVEGPSNMVIRNALKDFEVMRIPGHGFETFDRINDIRHGQPLEATGGGNIPTGTAVYPIKVDSSDGKDYVFAFYQDSFGEWKFQRME